MQHMATKLCHNYELIIGMCLLRFRRDSVPYSFFFSFVWLLLIFGIDTLILGTTKSCISNTLKEFCVGKLKSNQQCYIHYKEWLMRPQFYIG